LALRKSDWINKINNDLKSQASYENLTKQNNDRILVEPVYMNEDLQNINLSQIFANNTDWQIISELFLADETAAQSLLKKLAANGADIIEFSIENDLDKNYGLNFKAVPNDFFSEYKSIQFSVDPKLALFDQFDDFFDRFKTVEKPFLLTIDPLALKLKYPSLDFSKSFKTFTTAIENEHVHIRIDARDSHFLGANKIENLTFIILKLKYFLENLNAEQIKKFLNGLSIRFAISTDFFEEIASFRAFKTILNILANEYEIEALKDIKIEAESSILDFSKYDLNNNYLRSCSQTMSAVLAGYDRILCKAYDRNISYSSEFSSRIAANTQQLLKDESYLNLVSDPSSGSYYIESLSNLYFTETWKLLSDLEKKGDYLDLLEQSIIKNIIMKSRESKSKENEHRKKFVLGLNHFPNLNDKYPNPYTNGNCDKLDLKNILKEKFEFQNFSPNEEFENIRKKMEETKHDKLIFILAFGDLKNRIARLDFIKDFLSVAGFELLFNSDPNNFDSSMNEFKNSKAKVLVLCASDVDYTNIEKELLSKPNIFITGYDIENNQLNEINQKSNFKEIISSIQNELGLKL
jgi:methylmalonyl-CoA mutase